MKELKQYITEKLVLKRNIEVKEYNYHPKTKDELKKLVEQLIEERGNNADLNDIDVSEITNMSSLFNYSDFNGDISEWDVSNVRDMYHMFSNSEFNGDISNWDVSKVKNFRSMFEFSKFNQDISKWKINKNANLSCMCSDCPIKDEYIPKVPE